jgi:2-methylcitrate dehydratase PrpD
LEANTALTLASFASKAEYDHLPSEVVHETKRILLDVIGCALGAHGVAKGKLAVRFARETGGQPEASILGTSDKVGMGAAAFANAELMHGLDYCPLLPPGHISPFITAAPLAAAQARQASGKSLLLAVAMAHEVASRIGVSLDAMRAKEGGMLSQTWGLGFNTFGAAAGVGVVLGLGATAMNDAFGLAGYLSPVPSHNKSLNTTAGGGLSKYGPAGWTAQGGVTSAMLASIGYEGDRSVLDGEYGYWAMAGSKDCRVKSITAGLGSDWNLLRVMYKRWPCCGLFQSPLGAFADLVEEHGLRPDEIEHVSILNEGQGQLPRFRTMIGNHVDAQNSLAYGIAVVAHGIPSGPRWQSDEVMNLPGVRALMGKVSVESYAKAERTRHQELTVEGRPYIDKRPCLIDVAARGTTFKKEADYAKWLSQSNPAYRATDADLVDKFRANATDALGAQKADRAIDKIMTLDQLGSASVLLAELVP